MSSFSSFQKMLTLGQYYEQESQRMICARNGVSIISTQTSDNYKTYHQDFTTSDGISFEVKGDIASLKTGNVFIEFKQGEKLTGISITTADYHIIFSGTYYLIETDILKTLTHNRIIRRTASYSYGYIIPVSVIKTHAFILV